MLKTISRVVAIQKNLIRNIHISFVYRLREIIVNKRDDCTTVIEGRMIPSPRQSQLLKIDEKDGRCPLCQLNLNLKHTDVLILSQYLDSQGRILKRFETSLCQDQYKLVKELIYMAQYAGLLPEPPQTEPKKPYRLLNTYYDEKTICLQPKKHKHITQFKTLHKKLGPIERNRIKPGIGFYYGPEKK